MLCVVCGSIMVIMVCEEGGTRRARLQPERAHLDADRAAHRAPARAVERRAEQIGVREARWATHLYMVRVRVCVMCVCVCDVCV